MKKGSLFVVSGPSGVGKGTILQQIFRRDPRIAFSVSATTRAPRPGEEDGVHYHFLSSEKFRSLIDGGAFIEWAHVHGQYYGTPSQPVEERLLAGDDVVLDIDVQGALNVMEQKREAVFIFIAPPAVETLRRRLEIRGTEPEEKIEARVKTALWELTKIDRYDYVVFNDRLDSAVDDVWSVIKAHRCLTKNSDVTRFCSETV